ncbi:hypothetical protein R3W88_027453 [Solanum pinnatisectum]|uniref:RNA-directed DNA polymerase, eukaryota, reverse transcriptase zinc-binding domain protein n=1 Tax=Solanum pinnatisectum TaxID=50273 RepID=A0AAV9LG81_9SOLN|nr:hypothetical protein R3W88_027453 [Solanum pinnatisectum]
MFIEEEKNILATTYKWTIVDGIYGNPLYVLYQKLKNISKYLSSLSQNSYGDIYKEPKRLEAQMRTIEENCVNNNSIENRMELSRCRAEFIKYIKLQDSILRQKARIKWLEEGDANTAYFHSIIKDMRRRLTIRKKTWMTKNNGLKGTIPSQQLQLHITKTCSLVITKVIPKPL